MICPYCRNNIIDDAKYCPICGKRISNRINLAVNNSKAKVLLLIAIVFSSISVLFQVLLLVSAIKNSSGGTNAIIFSCIFPLLTSILLVVGCCLFPKKPVIAVIAALIIVVYLIINAGLILIEEPDFAAEVGKKFSFYANNISPVIGAAAFMVVVNVHRRIGLTVVFKIIVLLVFGYRVFLHASSLIAAIKLMATHPDRIIALYMQAGNILFYLSLILLAFVCPISSDTPKDTRTGIYS